MNTPDREPVAQRINAMILTLKEIAKMAYDDDTRAEVAAEESGLGTIVFKANMILSYLETYKPRNMRVVK